jgi:toxin ParE1/3/4
MTRIELAPEVLDDFERFMAHLAEHDVQDAPRRIGDVLQAIDILATSPLIGRPVKGGKRELVIGAGSGGYVALCSFVPDIDTVLVLAIRNQREAGMPPEYNWESLQGKPTRHLARRAR